MSQVNPFAVKNDRRKRKEFLGSAIFASSTYFVLLFAVAIFGVIAWQGAPVLFKSEAPFINTDFLLRSPETLVVYETAEAGEQRLPASDYREWKKENPAVEVLKEHTHSYSGGGIFGPLVGTALLVIICMISALAVGISAAVFLNEYAKPGTFLESVRLAIMNLAGVPSIVFGLFGLGIFCLNPWLPKLTVEPNYEQSIAYIKLNLPLLRGYLSFEGWGTSMLAGGLTLAIMVLPVIIIACEESLKAVPKGFREASLALGATKWQSIRTAVLPYAFPGMLTASVLGITRVAGETAPIMFTAALAHKEKLPWQDVNGEGLVKFSEFLTQSVQALPYHIYTVAARIPQSEYTEPMQHGSVFVFLLLVMGFAGISVWMRSRLRKKLKW